MADCNTRQGSRQHFCRFGVRRTPNSCNMSLAVNFLTSSIVRPSNFSAIIEAAAWLMQQPSPSKNTSRRAPPSSICNSMRTTSPQRGLSS